MPNEEDIQNQQKLLQIYRRRLAYALAQQAVGGMTAPFNVRDDIRECRTHIYQIKVILRDWGVTAADHPNDSDNADSPQPTLDSKNVEAERFNKIADLLEQPATKKDLNAAIDKILDLMSNLKQEEASVSDDKISIKLPINYWILILVALSTMADKSAAIFQNFKDNDIEPEDLSVLPREYITALVGPIIARAMIVEVLAENGIITKEAGEKKGLKALLKMANTINTEAKSS